MSVIYDPTEHALVMKALTSGLSNCVEWIDDKAYRRVSSDKSLRGVTPAAIIRELLLFVRHGGRIEQVRETRPEYDHRRYYYKAVLPHGAFPDGLFVEMEVEENTDPDVPCVLMLNAHPQVS